MDNATKADANVKYHIAANGREREGRSEGKREAKRAICLNQLKVYRRH